MKWLWLSGVVIVLDQLTKLAAGHALELHQPLAVFPSVNLTLTHNTGAAFSLLHQAGGWQRWFFAAIAFVVSACIVVWLYRLPRGKAILAAGLSLILGGALGNLWDRLSLGYVIDFIDLYYSTWHWPAFNVADSAITIGAGLLIADAFSGPAKV
ncbi:MAG: signal peptidase II [Gammaproteobacteria bacterium]